MTTTEEKRRALFLSQKKTLDTFFACGAITAAQYKKSLGDLVLLMGMESALDEETKKKLE